MTTYEPTEEDITTAGVVLKAIKQVDPYFVNATLDTARGWARILGPTDYTCEEMLAGVLDFYTHELNGRHCMPANVIAGAKRARANAARTQQGREAIERRRQQRRAEMDAKIAATKQQQALEQAKQRQTDPERTAAANMVRQLLERRRNAS